MKIGENVKRVCIVAFTVIASALLIYFAGPLAIRLMLYLFGLLSPFLIGYVIARLINPIADRLQKRCKIPRGISVMLVIIVTLVIIFGIVGGLGYKLFDEIRNLYYKWPQIFQSLSDNWFRVTSNINELYIGMPDYIQNALDEAWTGIYNQCIEFTKNIPVVHFAQVVAKSLAPGLIWTVMFILSLYFMVSRHHEVRDFLHKLIGRSGTHKLSEIKKQIKTYLGGYVKAQLLLMVIVFLVMVIMLSLFDAPFSVLVAALTAFLDALPFFGSGIVLWPMAVVYFVDSNIKLGIVYVATYFIIMLLRRFIEPKLVSDKLGLNPLVTLISMYVGYKLWGITGLITGPIILMIIISIYKVGLFNKPIAILKQLKDFTVKEIKLFENYLKNITK